MSPGHFDVMFTPDKAEPTPATDALPEDGIKIALHPDGKPGESTQASIATNGGRQIKGANASLEMLAAQLAWQLQGPVHDETHIDGHYDFRLDWIPDSDLPEGSIFSAITEQLGLRLESAKGPVQVYLVEKIERPTEN